MSDDINIKSTTTIESGSWHLEKKYAMGVLGFLFLQTAGFMYFGAQIISDFSRWKTTVELDINALKETDKVRLNHESRIITLEEQYKNTLASQLRMEHTQDRMEDIITRIETKVNDLKNKP